MAPRQREHLGAAVTVVIPTLPWRGVELARALASVHAQTVPCEVVIQPDSTQAGACATRNAGLAQVRSRWSVFLDDDDELLPTFVERCLAHAEAEAAGVVYPHYRTVGGPDPLGRGRPFRPEVLLRSNYIPVTTLVDTAVAQRVGGFEPAFQQYYRTPNEDHGLWIKLVQAGVHFSFLDEELWVWHFHPGQTAGLPT